MSRRTPTFWENVTEAVGAIILAPILVPIIVIVCRDEVEWPRWLVRLLYVTRLTSDERRSKRS